MAGEWLKMECATPDKPEVFAITAAMGWEDPDLTVGKLFRVWRWFDQQTTNGNARGVTLALLDRIACVTGFAQAMVDVGWLTQADGALELPNFHKHNGETAKKRAQGAKRAANHRTSLNSNDESNAVGVTDALPREEKRREESKPTTPIGVVVRSDAAGPDCPHREIIAAYHELLPVGTQVRVWNGTRAKHLQARWRESQKRQSIGWWRKFFSFIAESEFLTGRAPAAPGRDPFVVSLDWLVNPSNFAKVVEGKYHNREAA